jgi:hypothetical protein
MSASKRPSTSSLRRFITSRPFVTVAELRRRFGLDDPDAMSQVWSNGTSAWIGLPDREAAKLQDLWQRAEVGVELSVEVRASVVVGVYPMRIARYLTDAAVNGTHAGNGAAPVNGAHHVASNGASSSVADPAQSPHPAAPIGQPPGYGHTPRRP